MKLLFLIFFFTLSTTVYSSQTISGKFTTVSESACNSEIYFLKNGKGIFLDSCRNDSGSRIGEIYKNDISWRINDNTLLVTINGIEEIFRYHNNLPCKYFGERGDSNGLIGFDLYFWREPVDCK